mgnify:FL=1
MEDVLFGKSEEFRRVAPYFPEEVFEHLPDLLAQGVKAAGNYRERDMLLMAMITNISACLPRCVYCTIRCITRRICITW